MGESKSVAFVDLEKGAVESDEAAAAAKEDALIVGMFLGGLLLVVDGTILLFSGQRAALAVAILWAAATLFAMWYVRRTGPYRDEDVGQREDSIDAPQPVAAETRSFDVLRDAPHLVIGPLFFTIAVL
jgi:hypothetical protein